MGKSKVSRVSRVGFDLAKIGAYRSRWHQATAERVLVEARKQAQREAQGEKVREAEDQYQTDV